MCSATPCGRRQRVVRIEVQRYGPYKPPGRHRRIKRQCRTATTTDANEKCPGLNDPAPTGGGDSVSVSGALPAVYGAGVQAHPGVSALQRLPALATGEADTNTNIRVPKTDHMPTAQNVIREEPYTRLL